jgi:hypothetical protein
MQNSSRTRSSKKVLLRTLGKPDANVAKWHCSSDTTPSALARRIYCYYIWSDYSARGYHTILTQRHGRLAPHKKRYNLQHDVSSVSKSTMYHWLNGLLHNRTSVTRAVINKAMMVVPNTNSRRSTKWLIKLIGQLPDGAQ